MHRITIREIFRLSRPLFLLDAALLYTLGVGIARYLGATIDVQITALGLAWLLSLQLSAHYLYGYFSPSSFQKNQDENDNDLDQKLVREVPLWMGITALTITTSFTLLLIGSGAINVAVYLVLGLIAFGAFISAIPPLRVFDTPYRTLILSIIIANFVPALAFLLQIDGLHRLLSMSTFPLMLLHFSMLIILEFRNFGSDIRYERQSLLTHLGWQRGMRLVNLLILSAYLLLGIAMLIGLPLNLAWPAFLVFPLAVFLIWYLSRIAEGAKPQWKALNIMAMLVFGLTTYLLTFSFWTH